VGRVRAVARSQGQVRKRAEAPLFLPGLLGLVMRDDPFADDYANAVRCADCRCLLGTSSSSPVKLCAECALGETPKETMPFCPDCGTQRSRSLAGCAPEGQRSTTPTWFGSGVRSGRPR
jgi:NADH pyrophosphatase NudC (nudix superfamily)